jgi:hypothetical protein
MMIMSMGWDYVSGLRPPTGLLLIPQVIYERGESWWNDIDRGKLLIRPPELSGNCKQLSSRKAEGTGRRKWLILSYEVSLFDNSWSVALRQTKLVKWNIMDIPTSFIGIIIFFNGTSEYGDVGIFKLLTWIQNLHQSTWDHEVLYADISSKDKQLLIRSLLRKTKNSNMEGLRMLKFTYFMERIHELFLARRQLKFCTFKDRKYLFYLKYFLWQSFWIWQ